MQASGWTRGCLAQNLAAELAPGENAMAETIDDVFRSWTTVLARGLRRHGQSAARTEVTARAFLAALEGARTLARAARSAAPFEAIAAVMVAMLRTPPRPQSR